MRKNKTYFDYKKYCNKLFKSKIDQDLAAKKFSIRFNVSKIYADTITYKFYMEFFKRTFIKEWPLVNL